MLLRLKNVEVERDGRKIVQFANIDVKEGEIHGIIGLNGAGKSTLAYAIMGIIPISSGKILFEGEDISGLSITERARRA